jgi:hypothetical protein
MSITKTLLAATVLSLVAAPALANTNCLQPRHAITFKVQDKQTLIVRQGPNDEYKVSLAIKCQDLDFATAIGVKQLTFAMCVTAGDRVVYQHGGLSQGCIISKVEPYTAPNAAPESAPY